MSQALLRRAAAAILLLGLVLGVRVARADDPPAAPAGPPAGQGTASYHSPMRPSCEAELKKDKDWYADLKEQIWALVQKDASKQATDNNRHVVLAYGAFWLFTVGFVVLMWRRQAGLKAEIARLKRDLDKAEGKEAAT